jgi:hypothetical protein
VNVFVSVLTGNVVSVDDNHSLSTCSFTGCVLLRLYVDTIGINYYYRVFHMLRSMVLSCAHLHVYHVDTCKCTR